MPQYLLMYGEVLPLITTWEIIWNCIYNGEGILSTRPSASIGIAMEKQNMETKLRIMFRVPDTMSTRIITWILACSIIQ